MLDAYIWDYDLKKIEITATSPDFCHLVKIQDNEMDAEVRKRIGKNVYFIVSSILETNNLNFIRTIIY